MCFLWRERKGFVKISKNQKQPLKLPIAGEYLTSFQIPNVQYVKYFTEQWREMASLLGNTEKLSKLHADVRANKLNTIMKKTRGTVLTQLSQKQLYLKVL